MEKIWKHKSKFAAIALVLLMASVMLTLYTPVQAQVDQPVSGPLPPGVVPDMTESTRAFLSFRPNPVGVGQPILVNLWLNPALHRSRYHPDYKVTITDPDGNEDVILIDSYQADTTAWFEYVVDQVGEWTLKFDFAGTYFPGGDVPGGFGEPPFVTLGSVYYEPSSTGEQTLTVQEEMVYSWPPSPLPTDYWTRPASLEHREWWPILGNYPGTGYVGGGPVWDELYPDTNPRYSPQYDFHPWIQGPNTAHIVWKRLGAIAGLIGGPAGIYGDTGNPGTPDLIYAGRCYQTVTKVMDGEVTTVLQCYDLRTGEVHFEILVPATTVMGPFGPMTTAITPNIITYEMGTDPSVPGAQARATVSVELLTISGGRLIKFNPWTGAVNVNVSISPLTGSGGIYYMNQYVLDIQNIGNSTNPNYRLINWTTSGSTGNFANRVVSNTSYARRSFTETDYADAAEVAYRWCFTPLIDFNVGVGVTVGGMGWEGPTRVYEHMRIQAYNLETGVTLWDKITDEPLYSRSVYVADHGKIAVLTQGGYFLAYDLLTGNLAWKSEQMDYPWAAASFGAYAIESAYGMFYRQAYDGVYAFDWDDGSIVWKYKAPSLAVYESPYIDEDGEGVYPFNGGAVIADGKMYVYNTEHTASWPMTRGWGLHCINITTGEMVWKIGNPMTFGAFADGYLTAANSWDGYMYVFGKGKSATTISAPQTEIPLGESIMLTGTVLDQSPAQPGTPCVSKESMSLQMEYLHLQRPIAGLWQNETITGVPVSLDTVDPNGNFIHIGDVTSDGYSGTFGYTWTPEVPGTYTIMATFMGDDSYGSSFAQTYLGVGEAPEPPPEPVTPATEPEVQENIDRAINSLNPMFIGIIVAVAVAIVIGLLNLWMLRKRQ